MTEAITAAGGRSGAEEILARILENAGQAGDRLLAAADEKTEKILADAAAQAEQIRRKTAEAYAAKAEAALHAAASAAELETRNRLLRERRRILDETLKKTVGYLQGLPERHILKRCCLCGAQRPGGRGAPAVWCWGFEAVAGGFRG